MGISSHRDLVVWQKSIALVKVVYSITEQFPPKERYRLVDQLCRAVISIASNIAEGSARKSTKEFMRFISMAHGSLAEVETQIIIAAELDYIPQTTLMEVIERLYEIGRMLNALHNSLEQKLSKLSMEDV